MLLLPFAPFTHISPSYSLVRAPRAETAIPRGFAAAILGCALLRSGGGAAHILLALETAPELRKHRTPRG